MKIKEVILAIEQFAPLYYQESYDNSGVQVGDVQQTVTGVLLTLDITPAVIEEAIALGFNCVVAHHPLLFSGLKKLTGKNAVEQCVIKAIKNDIVLYAAHTNLDNVAMGVNKIISDKLGLTERSVLSPSTTHELCKFICYVPEAFTQQVQQVLFHIGAGHIGNYHECSFSTSGEGTFKPVNDAQPKMGALNERSVVSEVKIELLAPIFLAQRLVEGLRSVGYYEEVAYDIVKLENRNQYLGAGTIGLLPEAMEEQQFLAYLKDKMNAEVVKYTPIASGRTIRKVAVCGGSGSFLLPAAMAQDADVFVTADYKYHQFFEAEHKIMIADIGHYESEQFTFELLATILQEKCPEVMVNNTKICTNPVRYFK